jgi:hypothetical protein
VSADVSFKVPQPKDEYTLFQALKQEVKIAKEYTGAMGFFAGAGWDALFPDRNKGRDVYFQGSRQMTNLSRRYYERELGAGMAPSPSLKEFFGYSEPLRRFIQREGFEPQANEIPNTMPSWLPGDDYMTNFKVGDPYVRIDDGYARLPGAGYEALHPELKGVDPEEYPDIHKLRILADIAPYSREYNTYNYTWSFRPAGQHKSLAHARCRETRIPSSSRCFFRKRSVEHRSFLPLLSDFILAPGFLA